MKIYISGAITGTRDYTKRFKEAEEKLIAQGYDVINPAEINSHLPVNTTWDDYMKMSLVMLSMCDSIFMLKKWRESKGACIEYGYALGKVLNVEFE